MTRLRKARGALSYANVMATVAVFIALGGIAGAAVTPLLDKPGSVKGRHVARGAIHMSDLAPSVRNKIAVEPLPAFPDGTYTGSATDGSLSITALIRIGQVVQMSATGDCAFAAQSGFFDIDSTYKHQEWKFIGSGAVSATVMGSVLDGALVVDAVLVFAGATPKACETSVKLNPV